MYYSPATKIHYSNFTYCYGYKATFEKATVT